MIEWVVVRSDHRALIGPALARAWRGDVALVDLPFGAGFVTFVAPVAATVQRPARWPDVVVDWVEINEERLYPTDAAPVLAEELSGLGADVLALYAELDLHGATAGWYAKGALVEIEHVGASQLGWTPATGLGRPFDRAGRTVGAQVGHRIASLVGDERTAGLFDRLDGQRLAVGEAILQTALHRLLGETPPPMDELRGRVVTARAERVRIGG